MIAQDSAGSEDAMTKEDAQSGALPPRSAAALPPREQPLASMQ